MNYSEDDDSVDVAVGDADIDDDMALAFASGG